MENADAVFEKHRPRLERFLKRKYGRNPEGDDCIQEGLIKAWRGACSADTEFTIHAAFIFANYGALKHLDRCRRRSRHVVIDSHGPPPSADDEWLDEHENGFWGAVPDFAPALIRRLAASKALQSALRHATPLDRRILRLYYYEGLTQEEIGTVLNRDESTVRYHMDKYRQVPPAKEAITHCPLGHAHDQVNTYTTPRGQKHCRECRRIRQRRSSCLRSPPKRTGGGKRLKERERG